MGGYYRKKLNKLLGMADDEEFIQLLWATHALQSDYAAAGRAYIDARTIPAGAITTEMTSNFFVQKWEIETLANEIMAVPKRRPSTTGRNRSLRCDSFQSSIQCANLLRKLENAEYASLNRTESVSIEMSRIASRQFAWQRGYLNIPQFYRNAYVYGQGECSGYFERQHGITYNQFSQIGFMLFDAFNKGPVIQVNQPWHDDNVTEDEAEHVLTLIAMPFRDAAKLAQEKRKNTAPTAYRPSILRQVPCLRFGAYGERVRAPLPELIVERITSGVFYDVVAGGGSIRDDYGRRFEKYCLRYLSDTLQNFDWKPESEYFIKRQRYISPDILCKSSDKMEIAFECKATRMSQEAAFGKEPLDARGYEDITKAVFQLWRFFSHSRRGHTNFRVSDATVGAVLTLDNWLVMAKTIQDQVLEDATQMASKKDSQIIDVDRKPIVFITISELERTLPTATENTFKEALNAANAEQYVGWRLDSIHEDLLREREFETKPYPYADELGSLLPWWNNFS